MAAEATVVPSSFVNRRFLRKDLRTVFPAGFNSYQVANAAASMNALRPVIKGMSPPKPGTKGDTSTAPGNDGEALPATRESFMAWARGEVREDMTDDLNALGTILESDPYSDVAGPYFHVVTHQAQQLQQPQQRSGSHASKRPPTGMTEVSEGGLTDTLGTINSKLSIQTSPALAPPNVYNKELTMMELPIYQRPPALSKQQHQQQQQQQQRQQKDSPGRGSRERIFNAPSALPVLIPTLNLHSAMYEKAPTPQHIASAGSFAGLQQPSLATTHALPMDFDNWIDDRQQRGKSGHTFSLNSTTTQKLTRAASQAGGSVHNAHDLLDADERSLHSQQSVHSTNDKSVVIHMQLHSVDAQTGVATHTPAATVNVKRRGASRVKAVPLREQRDRFITIPPPASLGTGLSLDSASKDFPNDPASSAASGLLASYDPFNPFQSRSFPLQIFRLRDMLTSTSAGQATARPCRLVSVDAACSLPDLVAILNRIVLEGTPGNTLTTAATATRRREAGGPAKDPMVFFFRPAHNDWRPVRHALDWDQAKSEAILPATPLLLHGARAASTQLDVARSGMQIMFTENIEADMQHLSELAALGSDPSLLVSAHTSSLPSAATVSPLHTLDSAADAIGPSSASFSQATTSATAAAEGALGYTVTADDGRAEETTVSMILKIMGGPEESGLEGAGAFSPAPPSHRFLQAQSAETGGSRVITSTTSAAMAQAAMAGSARRQASVHTPASRSYSSAATTTLELPELAAAVHQRLAAMKIAAPARKGGKDREGREGREGREAKTGSLLRVVAIPTPAPTLDKMEEMARHLEQQILRTRF